MNWAPHFNLSKGHPEDPGLVKCASVECSFCSLQGNWHCKRTMWHMFTVAAIQTISNDDPCLGLLVNFFMHSLMKPPRGLSKVGTMESRNHWPANHRSQLEKSWHKIAVQVIQPLGLSVPFFIASRRIETYSSPFHHLFITFSSPFHHLFITDSSQISSPSVSFSSSDLRFYQTFKAAWQSEVPPPGTTEGHPPGDRKPAAWQPWWKTAIVLKPSTAIVNLKNMWIVQHSSIWWVVWWIMKLMEKYVHLIKQKKLRVICWNY